MLDINVLGTYKVINKVTIKPDKRCINCPFFDEGLQWCCYLKARVEDWNFNRDCPVKEITIEED